MAWLMNVAALGAWFVLVAVNYGAAEGWFGDTNAQVSNRYPTLLTPSGWAFSIWGPIILGQGAACVYLFFPSSDNTEQWKRRVGGKVLHWWVLGWACECAWQFCFTQASPAYMLFAVLPLLGALLAFQKALANLHSTQQPGAPALPLPVYALFFGPTSVNAAWLSVASSVGILVAVEANYYTSGLVYALALATAVVAVGIHITLAYKDVFYGVTLLWSFAAVYGAQRHAHWTIRAACITALVVLVPVSLSAVLRRRPVRSGGGSPLAATPEGGSSTNLLASAPDSGLRVPTAQPVV